MKKIITIFALFMAFSSVMYGQGNSGLGFNYQAVVRGADGFVVPSQSVEVRFSLMPGQQATQASWVETHNVTTDVYGTFGVVVGKGTKVGGVAANFSDVNFAAVHYWLKVEIKEGGNYRELSYTALASVPYAEAASNAASSPVGSVVVFAGDASSVPEGWLLCDGSAVSRSTYAALYAVIGTAWGYGDNATTFNIPDMRGVFLRGVTGTSNNDANADTRTPLKDGGNSGNNVGSFQQDAAPNIIGNINNLSHGDVGATADGAFVRASSGGNGSASGGGGSRNNFNFNASRSSLSYGRDNTTEVRPKNVYVNYIIKY